MRETLEPRIILLPQVNLADELASTLPLEHTSVTAQVTGPLAAVTVTQRFGNPLKEAADLDYLFPLPAEGAVTAFELTIGARRIQGDLQELEAAREAFERARGDGKRAGLLEQRRPNLFAVRLANTRPGETILATLRYHQRLKFEDGDSYEFVFPMGITPKYDSPSHPGEGNGVHAPIAFGNEPVGPVEIQVAVDAGVAMIGQPGSPSHPLEVTRIDERRFQVRLGGQHIPDHDFMLRYQVAGEQVQAAGWSSARDGKEIILASLLPARWEEEMQPPAREFVFVLDRSGSMSGEPIAQARNALRACLRAIGANDTFWLLLFDNQLEWYAKEPARITQAELERADAYLQKVQGRGGTEIVGAVEAALQLPADPARTRFVVFLTDGAVSAEARALDQIRAQVGQARLFTFGIGPSVNRALLSRMARLGRGRAEFLQLDEDIEGAIIRFQDSVSLPMLEDLALEWHNGRAWDVYPARLPDLYAGQPLEICGFVAREDPSAPLTLRVKGRRAGQPVVMDLALPAAAGRDPAVERVWARERVDDLFEQQAIEPAKASKIRAEVLGLALEYQLVTELTAFVAVDHDSAATTGKARVIHVAQPLPAGLLPGAFQAAPPVFAAMAAPQPMVPGAARGMAGGGMPRMAKSARREAPDDAVYSSPQENQGLLGKLLHRGHDQEEKSAPAGASREAELRWLARSQHADGSWGANAEQTAAALLAFIRAGHTTRGGSFRPAVRKAVTWLKNANLTGLAACLRARALAELAQATGDRKDAEAAAAARPQQAGGALEAAALDGAGSPPARIATLDDLRLAVLLKAHLPVPDDLLTQGLARTWAAAL